MNNKYIFKFLDRRTLAKKILLLKFYIIEQLTPSSGLAGPLK